MPQAQEEKGVTRAKCGTQLQSRTREPAMEQLERVQRFSLLLIPLMGKEGDRVEEEYRDRG